MPDDEKLVQLTALGSDGTEPRFDGAPMEPGAHLRWSFLPELGFPSGGFRVERRFFFEDEFTRVQPERDWHEVSTLKLATDLSPDIARASDLVLQRLQTGPGANFAEYYRTEVGSFLELLHQLLTRPNQLQAIIENPNRSRTRLRILDLLLLASLDPSIARLLSLYHVDGSVLPGAPVDYRVIGLWLNQAWPARVVSFDGMSPETLATGTFEMDGVVFFTGLALSLVEGSDGKGILRLSGSGQLPLHLTFPSPVEEVELEFTATPVVSQWRIAAALDDEVVGTPRIAANGQVLRISHAQQFDQLEITPLDSESWELASIRHRRRSGLIFDPKNSESVARATSPIVRLHPVAAITERPDWIARARPVPRVDLQALHGQDSPAMINDDGRVVVGTADVEMICRVSHEERESSDPSLLTSMPVRMEVGYTRTDGPEPRSEATLTSHGPLPWPMPELIASGALNSAALRVRQRNLSAREHGNCRFAVVRWGDDPVEASRSLGRAQPVLDLSSGRSGPGRLEVSEFPEINRLGPSVHFQLWVLPEMENVQFPALLSNGPSFLLGLARQTDGYAARFALNGRDAVESRGRIRPRVWSQVGVSYDGRTVRFFIDGSLDSEVAYRRGAIRPNEKGAFCIGCDPTPSEPFAFPFRGSLADLRIWRGAYAAPSTAHPAFLAGWALNHDLLDLKTRQPAELVGPSRFERDHPEHSDRRVLVLDGTSFLEVRDRPDLCDPGRRLTLQAWIRPEPGQATATIIGNGRVASYWFGLQSAGSGYRLRAVVAGSDHGSDGLIPAGEWSRVTVSLDGERIVFYIDGAHAGTRKAPFGRIRANPSNRLCIGADAGSVPGALRDPFRGRLADVHLWTSVPAAPSPALLGDKSRIRELQLRDHHRAAAETERRTGKEVSANYENLRAAWSFDGGLRELSSWREAAAIGTIRFDRGFGEGELRDEDRKVLVLNGAGCVEARGFPDEFYGFGEQLLVQAWIHPDLVRLSPDPADRLRQEMTILSNDRESSFAFGLSPAGADYRLWFLVNGRSFQSSVTIPARRWSRVGAGYHAGRERAFFYIDGRPDSTDGRHAPLGLIGTNHLRVLRIGGEAENNELGARIAYRGKLADVEIWTALPADPGGSLPDVSGLRVPADFIARQMPDGAYRFRIAGIDLFGRMSTPSFDTVRLRNSAAPPAPGATRAEFIPIRGTVVEVVTRPDESTAVLRVSGLDPAVADLGRLVGYDVHILRPRSSAPTFVDSQAFEILTAQVVDATVELSVPIPPFARLDERDAGKQLVIQFDQNLRVGWTWTGTQRLFAPQVKEFKIHHRHAVRLRTESEAGDMEARRPIKPETEELFVPPAPGWDLFDTRTTRVTLVDDVIEQDSPSLVLKAEPVPRATWRKLASRLPWIQESEEERGGGQEGRKQRARLFEVTIPTRSAVAQDPHRQPAPQEMDGEDFVPGALVAYNGAADAKSWQHFHVVWHELEGDSKWKLYFMQNRPGGHGSGAGGEASSTPASARPELTFARYYPGQRYALQVALPTPPDFNPSQEKALKPIGTVRYEVAVTTVDRENRESDKGIAASVVAVNRRRPPMPPRPKVEIGRANFYGESKATVRWEITPESRESGVTYQLYQATDSAIYIRDLEQRRRSQEPEYNRRQPGRYTGRTADLVFEDDPDFEDWLQARFPGWVGTWTSRMFVPKPADFEIPGMPDAERAAWERSKREWDEAAPVWRAWADRFYPALRHESQTVETDSGVHYGLSELQGLAERNGNETAFTLVNSAPLDEANGLRRVVIDGIEHLEYTDILNGAVRNRYFYRLRTQSPALLQSAGWGPVSEPKSPEKTRPPVTPALTRIEAGERRLTVRWTISSEPDLAEYRLYRARTREALADLRWWRPKVGEWVKPVADPRLRVLRNAIVLPEGLDVAVVLGVFRLHGEGGRAFDYFRRGPDSPSDVTSRGGTIVALSRLAPLPDGAAVILVYRRSTGEERTLGSLDEGGAYVDDDLLPGEDYFYRLVAVDAASNVSQGSIILQARAFDTTPPRLPTLAAAFEPTTRQVQLSWEAAPDVQHMIQRHQPGGLNWKDRSGWLPAGVSTFIDEQVHVGITYLYRLRLRSASGVITHETVETACTTA